MTDPSRRTWTGFGFNPQPSSPMRPVQSVHCGRASLHVPSLPAGWIGSIDYVHRRRRSQKNGQIHGYRSPTGTPVLDPVRPRQGESRMTSGHQSLAAATGTAGTPQPSATTAEPAPTRPTDVRGQGPQHTSYDVIIVGSGMGGGTLAYALKDSGARVLLIERGDYVPYERQNWDPVEVFGKGRYKNAEKWYDVDGKPFSPGTYYYVGGNTKFYGASLARFRREDFRATEHQDGASPAWFMQYEDLEPYYRRAEQVYRVHGDNNDDPSLPRPDSFPFPAIGHEPPIQRIADKMRKVGFTPSNIPLGIDLRQGGRCIRCKTCDGYPCLVGAKLDADVACIRPALQTGTVELLTNSYVEQVL